MKSKLYWIYGKGISMGDFNHCQSIKKKQENCFVFQKIFCAKQNCWVIGQNSKWRTHSFIEELCTEIIRDPNPDPTKESCIRALTMPGIRIRREKPSGSRLKGICYTALLTNGPWRAPRNDNLNNLKHKGAIRVELYTFLYKIGHY